MADPETKAEHRKGKKTAQSHYDPYNLNVPVVVVTSEVAPYSKRLGPVSCHARGQSLPGFCFSAAFSGLEVLAWWPHPTLLSSPGERSMRGQTGVTLLCQERPPDHGGVAKVQAL